LSVLRLNITVEGQTEEGFVKRVLAPHLGHMNIAAVARRTLTGWKDNRSYRGGWRRSKGWEYVARDVRHWMLEDDNPEAWFTTMFDLYALPIDTPGLAGSPSAGEAKAKGIEEAIRGSLHHPRFIPYIQLHEFEALILSDPRKLDWEFLEHSEAIGKLISLVEEYDDKPEAINDGKETAPSKRIISAIPEYDGAKAIVGPSIAEKIGLGTMRRKCPHFDAWLSSLEKLSPIPP
jgi:hypothetical protein